MRILRIVKALVISSYGESHMVRPSHSTGGVTAFHVSYPSLFCTGIFVCLYHFILQMMWQPSTFYHRHFVYIKVGRFLFLYVRMPLTHHFKTVWLSLSTSFSHPFTTVWLSLRITFSIYR